VVVVGGLVAVSIALGATTAIAEGSDLFGLRERSGVRGELWAEAADLAEHSSLRGVGPGSFATESSVSIDADLRWAHDDFLQQAAEQGLVGLVLLLALVGCGFARLWVGRRPRAHTLAGAAALTLVGLHATVDHLLSHAAVPLTLSLLVGWATGDRRGRAIRSVSPTTPKGEPRAGRLWASESRG
jgi:O-antigen ligase